MKNKKHKYAEDLVEDYLSLLDEINEINLLIARAKENEDVLIVDQKEEVIKKRDLEDIYKVFSQTRKYEERKKEAEEEFSEAEATLKQFLRFVNGKKIAYEKKDDAEKTKLTYLFWMENDQIMCKK